MNLRTVVTVVGAIGSALIGLPAIYLSKRLYTSGLNPEYDRRPEARDLTITALSGTSISLRANTKEATPRADEPGHFLVEGARGYGFAGPVTESNGIVAVREFRPGEGDLRIGDAVLLDSFAFPGDPQKAHGIAFEDVPIPSPLGNFPAWYVRGDSDTWAIMTHGKGASRRETLRMMPALVKQGIPCLAISYRNDVDSPAAPNGMYSYGRDEWEEVEAAAEWAFERGARRLLLVGYSMGGATTLGFMAKSRHANRVAGLILDAPMIDLTTTVRHGAKALGVPLWFLGISNRVTAWRYGFRWTDFDHRAVLETLSVPVLLFHGDSDKTVPVSTSDAFARARPDIVEYYRPEGVDHVRAWNADPTGYEAAVSDFARRVASS